MDKKLLFQDLPQELQDELRDAPIAAIEDGKVIVECMGRLNGIMHQLYVELKPRTMEDHAVVYITQDLQDIQIHAIPLRHHLSA